MNENNPRAFIDMNGGYQSHREGADKLAHDAWVKSNTWGLTRDDFIRLAYFHGDLESGSDGLGPVNGSEDRPHDAVYIGANGGVLSRSMVSYWLADCNSFMHGYKTAVENAATQPPQDERGPVALSTLTAERPIDDEVIEAMRVVDWQKFGSQSIKPHYAALASVALQSFGSQLEAIAMDNDLAMGDRLQRIVAQIAEWRKS